MFFLNSYIAPPQTPKLIFGALDSSMNRNGNSLLRYMSV